MKIVKHITFFYNGSNSQYLNARIDYINTILDETSKYGHEVDVFIHTNGDVTKSLFRPQDISVTIVFHPFVDPMYLPWKCRELLKTQRNEYDIFMYVDDDMLVPTKALNYWIENHERVVQRKFNLGFVRIEVEDGIDYISDLEGPESTLNLIITLNGETYCVNNYNPYCAFWIYDKTEFNKFVDSPYFDLTNIRGYGIVERSGIGLHGLHTNWYTRTIIPMVDDKLTDACKIYHLPNNYVKNKSSPFGIHKFDEAIRPINRIYENHG